MYQFHVQRHQREWIIVNRFFLKQTRLKIVNARVCSDKHEGSYTYVGVNGSSLVDFCITDPSLFEYLKTCVVHDPCILSDHCLMEFSFVK